MEKYFQELFLDKKNPRSYQKVQIKASEKFWKLSKMKLSSSNIKRAKSGSS